MESELQIIKTAQTFPLLYFQYYFPLLFICNFSFCEYEKFCGREFTTNLKEFFARVVLKNDTWSPADYLILIKKDIND